MESKIEATKRLQADSRWDQASSYRDRIRTELRAEGLSRREATARAWPRMIEKFPPVQGDESVSAKANHHEIDDAAIEELAQRTKGNAADLTRDVFWTYDTLDRRKATVADAPCPGAWSLLLWSRKNRDPFFAKMLPRAMAQQAVAAEPIDDGPSLADVVVGREPWEPEDVQTP